MRHAPLPVSILALAFVTAAASAQSTGWHAMRDGGPAHARFVPEVAGMATDTLRGRAVLYRPTLAPRTWELIAGTWRPIPTANLPPAPPVFNDFALTFDANRGVTILALGFAQGIVELWEYDGVDWTRSSNPPPPLSTTLISPRVSTIVHDPVRNQLVLIYAESIPSGPFSSREVLGMRVRDAQGRWSSQTFTNFNVSTVNGAIPRGAVTYHAGLQAIVYLPFDTFDFQAWNGTSWQTVAATGTGISVTSLPKSGFASGYDDTTDRLVVFGGSRSGNEVPDTFAWERSSGRWSRQATTRRPIATRDPVMTAAPGGGVLVAGGFECPRPQPCRIVTPAVWRLGVVTGTTTAIGPGCAGSAGIPTMTPRNQPTLGGRFDLDLTSLPAAPTTLTLGLIGVPSPPVPLAAAGMPGCSLRLTIHASLLLGTTPNSATWSLTIPDVGDLLGLSFDVQAAVTDAAANAGGLVMSNALRATVGMR
ncbi:MAG: hypothetical protein RL562_1994 [Planctomycetota bacterium]